MTEQEERVFRIQAAFLAEAVTSLASREDVKDLCAVAFRRLGVAGLVAFASDPAVVKILRRHPDSYAAQGLALVRKWEVPNSDVPGSPSRA